jgi:hypothetical protein
VGEAYLHNKILSENFSARDTDLPVAVDHPALSGPAILLWDILVCRYKDDIFFQEVTIEFCVVNIYQIKKVYKLSPFTLHRNS